MMVCSAILSNLSTTYYNKIYFHFGRDIVISCVCKPFPHLHYSLVGVYVHVPYICIQNPKISYRLTVSFKTLYTLVRFEWNLLETATSYPFIFFDMLCHATFILFVHEVLFFPTSFEKIDERNTLLLYTCDIQTIHRPTIFVSFLHTRTHYRFARLSWNNEKQSRSFTWGK